MPAIIPDLPFHVRKHFKKQYTSFCCPLWSNLVDPCVFSVCGLWWSCAHAVWVWDKSLNFSKPQFHYLYNEENLHEIVATLMYECVRTQLLPGVVAHACNRRTPEVKTWGSDLRSQPRLHNGTLLNIHGWEGSSVIGCLYTIYKAPGFILRTEGWGRWGAACLQHVKPSKNNNRYLSESLQRELVLRANYQKFKISFRLT